MSHQFLNLFYVANLDYSWLAKILSLLVLPLAHEDLAILLGGYMVVNKLLPTGLVAIAIYGGMVVSDFALYGVGAAARRLPWLKQLAVKPCVVKFGETLRRNLFGLAALSRVVPGLVFVVMIASGWTRIQFSRFALASLVTSALYLPFMLYLVVLFGDALDDHVGLWTWPFLLGVIAAVAFMRYRVLTFSEAESGAAARQKPGAGLRRHPLKAARFASVRMSEAVDLPILSRPARSLRAR